MKKKILVISNMYPSKKNKTFGIFVKNQVKALRDNGLKVDTLVINESRMGKVYVIQKYLKWMMSAMKDLLLKGKDYQLVHAHYVFPSGLLGLMFKRLFGTRLIVTAHGGDIDRMARKNKQIFNLTKKILHESDHVIAVGDKLKADIVKDFEIEEGKVSVLNMGVNRTVFAPVERQLARKQLNLNQDNPILLYVGNIIKAKGLLELINAYKVCKETIPSLELHLIGAKKEPSFYEQLVSIIRDNQLTDITFHEAKGQKEVAVWMNAADAFILPSHMEGFGLVALEAMSCSTPVIGSDIGGLSYLLDGQSGYKVLPKDSTSLANGIKEILINDELRTTIIKNGESKARAYDQEVVLQRLLEIYEGRE